MQEFRIIETPEASLAPSAVWKHWKEHILLDHRTYYGILEFLSVLTIILSPQVDYVDLIPGKYKYQALIVLAGICPIHWYGNQRASSHVLTRARNHCIIISLLVVISVALQIFPLHQNCLIIRRQCDDVDRISWLYIPILLFADCLVFLAAHHNAQNLRNNPLILELPFPPEEQPIAWTEVNVADCIEDDAPEVEGAVQLT